MPAGHETGIPQDAQMRQHNHAEHSFSLRPEEGTTFLTFFLPITDDLQLKIHLKLLSM